MGKLETWSGRYLEDFTVGDVYQHHYGRTVIDADSLWFSTISMSANEQYFNREYARAQGGSDLEVNPAFVMALVTGMSVSDISQNGVNLEWKEVSMPNPLYVGETVHAESEVLSVRESKSKPGQGIVSVKTRGITETGKVVLELVRSILIYKRDAAPQRTLFPQMPEWTV